MTPGEYRSGRAADMRRWRARTGRTPTVRVPLVTLGRLLLELSQVAGSPRGEALRIVRRLLGDDVCQRAVDAHGAAQLDARRAAVDRGVTR